MTLEQEKQAAPKTNGAHHDKDWANDYDIFDPSYIKNPFPVWDELRDKCPVAHTERWAGSWMPTKYADLFAIAQDFQRFSSRDVLVAPIGAGPQEGEEPDPDIPEELQGYEVGAPPITSDPPIHTWSRRLLLSPFSIKSIAHYEAETRELCQSLIDGFIDKGRC